MVSFSRREDGCYAARIDSIEIVFGDRGFEILRHKIFYHVPCEYGPCPVDGGYKPEWVQTDDCSPEYQEEEIGESIYQAGYLSIHETIVEAKRIIRKKLDKGRSWPASANRFVVEPWTHKPFDR